MSSAVADPRTFRRPNLTPRTVAPRLPMKLEEIDLDHLPLYPLLNKPIIVVADFYLFGVRETGHALLLARDDARGLVSILPLDAAPHVEPITLGAERVKPLPSRIAQLAEDKVERVIDRIRRLQSAVRLNILAEIDPSDVLGAPSVSSLSSSSQHAA